jgi:hypothetical protein
MWGKGKALNGEAFLGFIGKHVMDMSLGDFLFVTLPEACVQQVAMVLHEDRSHSWIAQ